MSAAADDDEIIGRFGFRLAPGLRPTLMAREALANESERGIMTAHATSKLPRTSSLPAKRPRRTRQLRSTAPTWSIPRDAMLSIAHKDEPASPPLPRPQSYQKTRKTSYKDEGAYENRSPVALI